jgi:hypothetical protein
MGDEDDILRYAVLELMTRLSSHEGAANESFQRNMSPEAHKWCGRDVGGG